MMQGSSKSIIKLRASVARQCIPVTHNIRTATTASTDSSSKNNINNNSVIPTLPELHYNKPPEQITIDAAMQALYEKLPRGESWDRQPEDIRLMNGTEQESIVRFCFTIFLLFKFDVHSNYRTVYSNTPLIFTPKKTRRLRICV